MLAKATRLSKPRIRVDALPARVRAMESLTPVVGCHKELTGRQHLLGARPALRVQHLDLEALLGEKPLLVGDVRGRVDWIKAGQPVLDLPELLRLRERSRGQGEGERARARDAEKRATIHGHQLSPPSWCSALMATPAAHWLRLGSKIVLASRSRALNRRSAVTQPGMLQQIVCRSPEPPNWREIRNFHPVRHAVDADESGTGRRAADEGGSM